MRHIYETTPPTPRTTPIPRKSDLTQTKPRSEPPPGATLPSREARVLAGRYALEKAIDRGGTATIHRALDLATGEQRAVKILDDDAAREPLLRRLFLEGARAAMTISHQNVVRVLSVHEPSDANPYAVMELLTGEPLNVLLAREQRLAEDVVVPLARGAARGLGAAHASGVVHCDVKPENLFAVGTAKARSLKILDFDLASLTDSDAETDAGALPVLRGTAKYMAPEQIVGDPVDPRTDVYALGVVLFRLLTGHLPFDMELGATLLRHQLGSPVPPPSWLVEHLDARLDRVVVRATRKDPARRYPDMASLVRDLDAIELGLALSEPPSPAEPDRYRPRTERGHLAARALGVEA